MIKQRNIVLCIIFSIITCGIYALYWFVKMTNEMNAATNSRQDASGIAALLFSLVTCGIYTFFWAYKMGSKVDRLNGTTGGSTNILYLVLALFGFSIINYALIQDALNKNAGENILTSASESDDIAK